MLFTTDGPDDSVPTTLSRIGSQALSWMSRLGTVETTQQYLFCRLVKSVPVLLICQYW